MANMDFTNGASVDRDTLLQVCKDADPVFLRHLAEPVSLYQGMNEEGVRASIDAIRFVSRIPEHKAGSIVHSATVSGGPDQECDGFAGADDRYVTDDLP